MCDWCGDVQGYVFVDRDGKHFRHVLNWLRDGVVPTLTDAEYPELAREAEYYQLVVCSSLTTNSCFCIFKSIIDEFNCAKLSV